MAVDGRVGIRVVANAGGINLLACAEMVKKVASEEGVDLSVAMVTRDDLMKKASTCTCTVRVTIRRPKVQLQCGSTSFVVIFTGSS